MAAKKKAPEQKPKAPVKRYDWEAIERDYRTGKYSIRELSRKHGPVESAIRKRKTRDGWEQDLRGKVRDRVSSKLVRRSVRTPHARDPEKDEAIVEEAAEIGAEIITSHRKDIAGARGLCLDMFRELKSQTESIELLEEAAEQMLDEEKASHQRRSMVRRAISLPSRAGTLRDLANSTKILQTLERQAWDLDDSAGVDPLDDLLAEVSDTSRGIDGYSE